MDILTEIFRIKQVMGLITEQSSSNLVTDDVYEAIKNIESEFSATDENGKIIGIAYNPRGKESNIKKAIEETIGLDDWGKMDSNLKGQIYSFMFQSDSGPRTRLRWLAGLAQAIDPKINRTNIVDKPITDSNVQSAIKLIKDNINSINYNKYMTVVKDQYKNISSTINDDANKLKIWGPRPEALDKLMSGESWPDVKAWWYNEIGEPNQTTQTTNTPPRNATSTNNSQSTAITPAAAATTSQTATASTNIGTLVDTTLEEGQPGDPYVYIKNEDGDFLTYKCGKTNERCPDLSTNLYSVPWINVTQKLKVNPTSDKYKNAEEAIRTSIYKEGTPTPEEETEPEETTPTPTKQNILNKFRDYYYSTYLWHINSSYSAKITRKPVKPTYKGQIKLGSESVEINLVGDVSSTPSGITVGAQLFTKIMKNFITKKVNVGNVQYELKAYNADAISPAESIFKRDSTGYVGDIKAENEIKSEKLGIYKVE
jgi:hypothetical protein